MKRLLCFLYADLCLFQFFVRQRRVTRFKDSFVFVKVTVQLTRLLSASGSSSAPPRRQAGRWLLRRVTTDKIIPCLRNDWSPQYRLLDLAYLLKLNVLVYQYPTSSLRPTEKASNTFCRAPLRLLWKRGVLSEDACGKKWVISLHFDTVVIEIVIYHRVIYTESSCLYWKS